ncbi:MAG: hypothetical protein ABIH26_14695 [Candidatus Eisenbacteria bacterium]
MAWHYLQYAMGLARLGHDVCFIEDSEDYPCCYDPERQVTDTDPAYGLAFAKRVFERTGLGDRWAYHDAHKSRWHGPRGGDALDICRSADLVLNISGANPMRPWFMDIPVRVFIDTDPVFEQIRQSTIPERRRLALQHTRFLTFGENIANLRSAVPSDEVRWKATRQPIVLDAWPVTPPRASGRFTTVMQWESYPPREHRGVRYGLKSASFEPVVDLPAKAGAIFELALGSPSAPRGLLMAKGWKVRNPLEVTRDPWAYQEYIRRSKAEFTVAKHGYVVARSGWFSERSAGYLASGRPVLTEETGFSDWMAAGAGVVPFATPEEAAAGVEEINARYESHCLAARALVEEFFDSDKVLARLIESVGGSS